jgi:hypothetical protein
MCDYSLDFVASRPARVGDKLVSTGFRNSVTRGFAAIGEPNVAVCLLPGTEVAFERDVECGSAFRRSLGQKVARFRQLNLDQPTAHHDALEFPDEKSPWSQTSARVSTQRCFSCPRSQRSRLRQMPRIALPTWNDSSRQKAALRSSLLCTRQPVIAHSIRNVADLVDHANPKERPMISGSECWIRSDLPLMWRSRGRVVVVKHSAPGVASGKLRRLLPFFLGNVG